MGVYESADGRFYSTSYDPSTNSWTPFLTLKGQRDTNASVKIQRWWRSLRERMNKSVEHAVEHAVEHVVENGAVEHVAEQIIEREMESRLERATNLVKTVFTVLLNYVGKTGMYLANFIKSFF